MGNNLRFLKEVKKIQHHQKLISQLSQDELIKIFHSTNERVIAYAVISEVIERTLSLTPYVEQLLSAIALDEGFIIEQKTGEGKSLVSLLLSLWHSLSDRVYVVTVNDYLASRDFKKTRSVCAYLNVMSGFNEPFDEHTAEEKKSSIHQKCQIIYTSSMELIFDYLRSEEAESQIFLSLDYVIIDEIDFVLIDNANSSFSLSKGTNRPIDAQLVAYYQVAQKLSEGLRGGRVGHKTYELIDEHQYDIDYIFDLSDKTCCLTDEGIQKLLKIFNENSLDDLSILYKAVLDTLEAQHFLHKDKEYVIQDNRIVLINPDNGRLMANSSKDNGLQLALEIKEKTEHTSDRRVINALSYQVFFSFFRNFVGLSGTVKDAEEELITLFGKSVYIVPSHKPLLRVDYDDKFFQTRAEKYQYLLKLTESLHKQQRPLLIVTENEYESEQVYLFLKNSGYLPNHLTATCTEIEPEIVEKSGNLQEITISTNLVGRGTDIVITPEALECGGLFVCVLNRYESVRVEKQIRGRAGRQGQPGACVFLASLDDEIFKYVPDQEIRVWQEITKKEFGKTKNQKKLATIVFNIQSQLEANWRKHRQLLFVVENLVQTQKKNIRSQIENWENWEELVESELNQLQKIELKEPLFFWGEVVESYTDEIALKIQKEFKEKFKDIGESLAFNLMRQIARDLLKKHWEDYRLQIQDLALSYNLGSTEDKTKFAEYLFEVNSIHKKFVHFLQYETLGMFLKAKRRDTN